MYSCNISILGLSPLASTNVVKRAYKRLALKYHPEVNRGETKKEKEEVIKEIKSTYESLMVNSKESLQINRPTDPDISTGN